MCIHKHTYNHEATKLFACIRMYYRESDIEKDGDKDEPVWFSKTFVPFRSVQVCVRFLREETVVAALGIRLVSLREDPTQNDATLPQTP